MVEGTEMTATKAVRGSVAVPQDRRGSSGLVFTRTPAIFHLLIPGTRKAITTPAQFQTNAIPQGKEEQHIMMHNQTAVEVTCLSFNGRPFTMEEAARRLMELYPDRCLSCAEAWQELEQSGVLVPTSDVPLNAICAEQKLRMA